MLIKKHSLIFSLLLAILILSQWFLTQGLQARTPPHSFSAKHMVFSKDNSQLTFLGVNPKSYKTEIVKMDTKKGIISKRIPLVLKNNPSVFAATPDGFKLLATSPQGISVIHNGTGKILRTLPYPSNVKDWRFIPVQSHDGVLLAIPSVSQNSGKILLIHTGSGKIIRTVDLLKGEKWIPHLKVGAIGFNHNRRILAYTTYAVNESTLHIYDINKQEELFKIDIREPNSFHYETIHFNKNGNKLTISAHNHKSIKLVDLPSKVVTKLNYPYSSFAGFTSDDNLIIVQPVETKITIRNLKTGKTTNNLIKLESTNNLGVIRRYGWKVTQSLDKSLLALPFTSSDFKKVDNILLIDAKTGRLLRHLEGKPPVK